jgi:hypothetical protein
MTNQAEFFRTQAREMRAQGEAALLANVRERCLRSAEAWTHMAERAEHQDQNRAKAEKLKAQAQAAQAAQAQEAELQAAAAVTTAG